MNLPVYIEAQAIETPMGHDILSVWQQISQHKHALTHIEAGSDLPKSYYVSVFNADYMQELMAQWSVATKFDAIMLNCIHCLQQRSSIDLTTPETLVVLSTTKGNISLLANALAITEELFLQHSARKISQFLQHQHAPIVISNACISGVSALIYAQRMLQEGLYKHAVVIGCDEISAFILHGFNSFHAISSEPCQPFDKNRKGITLGEAAAAVVLTTQGGLFRLGGGCISNDANHISGPSKTGHELAYCIQQAMQQDDLQPLDIGFIAAHGTATPYNDDMESKAIEHAGLQDVPAYSIKAALGHTLGATGVLEIILGTACLSQQHILPSMGLQELGVAGQMTVNKSLVQKTMRTFIKTASGFGGCNAALLCHMHT